MRVGCLVLELAGIDARRASKRELAHHIGSLPRPLWLVTALEANSTMLLPETLAALEKVEEAAKEEAAREEAAKEAAAKEEAAKEEAAREEAAREAAAREAAAREVAAREVAAREAAARGDLAFLAFMTIAEAA
jgi:hypothetical protein